MRFTLPVSAERIPVLRNRWLLGTFILFMIVWINTLAGTTDLANWILENILTVLFVSFLFLSYKHYQFSDLSYVLIGLYLCLHVYGSQYTYAENPFGYWLKDFFGLSRNHYDRIVHFGFGFLLATPLREIFMQWLKYPSWVAWLLPIELTLSISAFYELIEWAVADIFFTAQGAAYLGTQGDMWDAQKDVFLALSGAIIATTIVSLVKKIIERNHRRHIGVTPPA